jgi:hypothetical protein
MASYFIGYWQWQIILYRYLARQPVYAMGVARKKIVIYEIFLDRVDSRALSYRISFFISYSNVIILSQTILSLLYYRIVKD